MDVYFRSDLAKRRAPNLDLRNVFKYSLFHERCVMFDLESLSPVINSSSFLTIQQPVADLRQLALLPLLGVPNQESRTLVV